jgi:hypothetical protein
MGKGPGWFRKPQPKKAKQVACTFFGLEQSDGALGFDDRVGLNFAVTILGLLFDFQTLRQGAAVRRR